MRDGAEYGSMVGRYLTGEACATEEPPGCEAFHDISFSRLGVCGLRSWSERGGTTLAHRGPAFSAVQPKWPRRRRLSYYEEFEERCVVRTATNYGLRQRVFPER